MPKKPVILALLAAIIIVVASMWLLRPPSARATAGPQPVLDADAASIVAFETNYRDGGAVRVERTLLGWQLVVEDAPTWAVQEVRPRLAARILAELQGRPIEDPGDLSPVATTLTITDARGRKLSLGLREPVIGGRRVVDRVDADGAVRHFSIDQELYELFAMKNVLAWRDEGLLGALPGRPARLELSSGATQIDLARVEGNWSLRAPVAARASEEAIDTLLRAIADLRVERFDETPPSLLEESNPVSITLEADTTQPGEDPSRPLRITERVILTLHGPADTGGRLTRVGVTREREERRAGAKLESLGTSYVAIDLEPLQQIALQARDFVARTALPGDGSLIAGLSLGDRAYTRTGDGWAEGDTALPQDRAAALDALTTLLTTTVMAGVELTTTPQPLGRASRPVPIGATSISGDPLGPADGLTMFTVAAPSGASGVLIVGGGVTREYTDPTSLAIARAVLVLSEPIEAEPPSEGG
jgi:hypothetical protein